MKMMEIFSHCIRRTKYGMSWKTFRFLMVVVVYYLVHVPATYLVSRVRDPNDQWWSINKQGWILQE